MGAHDDTPIRVSVEHGPGWDTSIGRRVGDYLREQEDAVGLVLSASKRVPDLIVVTGEAAAVRAFMGAPPPTSADPYETGVTLPGHALERLAADSPARAERVRGLHERRGAMRTILVCLGGEVTCVQILVEPMSAAVAARRGGLA